MYSVKGTRKVLCISQKLMAKLMGMHQTGIARIESGKRSETIIQEHHLAALLVLQRHELLGELTKEVELIVDIKNTVK